MLAWIRTTKGLGNAAEYLSARSGSGADLGKFWDWVGLAWVTPETADCKKFMTEYADSDTVESLYAVEFTPPSGLFIVQAVTNSTGEVEGAEISGVHLDPDYDAAKTAAQDSTVAKAVALATVAGYIDTEIQTLLDRIGAFTGTGVNTVLGFFKALLKKDAAIPSDIGGTFDPATDSTEAIAEKLVDGVTINPIQATNGVLQTAITEGDEVSWKRGDADRLTVNLGSTYAKAGAKFYLCIKSNKTDAATEIVNRECTITDAANVVGYIDLTAAEMAVVGKYHAEIERRDADGTSNPKTCWEAVCRITQDGRQ